MNLFRTLMIMIYLCLYLLVGGIFLVMAFDVVPYEKIVEYVGFLYNNPHMKFSMGAVGILFILIGIFSTKVSFGKMRSDKTIAFENPDGQVLVSLAAIEDYIRRLAKTLPQVKDLKSYVSASKKGVSVLSKATLFSDSNIPEVTEKIQAIIKNRLLEMLGIEETISVKIHISKLINRSSKDEGGDLKEIRPPVPFRGLE